MVYLEVKFPGQKVYRQYHRTIASARKTQKFVGSSGKTKILSRGKDVTKRRTTHRQSNPFNFRLF